MLICLSLVLAFTLLGFPLTQKNRGERLLLAPVLGLAASVFLAYLISMNFRLDGAESVALSLIILVVFGVIIEWRAWKTACADYSHFKSDAQSALLAIIPVVILVAPALLSGIENFFGVVNFDFFYNSQESWYLATHSVLDFYPGKDRSILPLDWSSHQQGRFAISLAGAFVLKFLDLNPLHFNSALLTALLIISSFTATAFARRVLGVGLWPSALAAGAFIISAGCAQGYIYYLLGQISAIPLFIAICIFTSDLLIKLSDDASGKQSVRIEVLSLVLLLNALYVFYTILSFFALAVILAAAFFNGIRGKSYSPSNLICLLSLVAATVGIFLLVRITSLMETKRVLLDWITLALKTADNSQLKELVLFSEYLTEASLALLLGIFVYPTNNSGFSFFLGSGHLPSSLLLFIGLVALGCLLLTISIFMKEKTVKSASKAVVLAIATVSLSCALLFYITKSGYAMFKIGSWLIPTLLMISVASLWYSRVFSRGMKTAVTIMASGLILMNALSALNYSYAFFSGSISGRFSNLTNLNEPKGIGSLKAWLATHPGRPLVLDLSDGIKAAWLANEFRDREVSALTHNYQPLEDRVLPDSPCVAKANAFSGVALLVTDKKWLHNKDILAVYPEYSPVYSGNQYYVYQTSNIEHYAFLGRGTYPAYTLSPEAALRNGLPLTFRWLERGVEIYVYSKEPANIDIAFDAVPGHVTALPTRNILLKGQGLERSAEFTKDQTHLQFESIRIPAGLSCFYLLSPDPVERLPRYGALFRSDIPLDFRFLNYALGNLVIRFKTGKVSVE